MFDRDFWRDNWALVLCGGVGLSVSAIVLSNQTGQPLLPQIDFKELLAPYIPGLLAILKGALLAIVITAAAIIVGFLTIPFRNWLKYQMEQRTSKATSKRVAQRVAETDPTINDYRQNHRTRHQMIVPVAATDSRLESVIQERDEWRRKYNALLQARPEPERELTYQAVAALLKTGNVGIKEAIRVVRENGGVVGRKGYDELRDLLALLPSPTAEENPDSRGFQAVNCEPERVNHPVNRPAMGRSQPRRRRG